MTSEQKEVDKKLHEELRSRLARDEQLKFKEAKLLAQPPC